MQPRMDSNYTGQIWVDEVLNGHDDRCMISFRMPKNIFHRLLHDLQTNYGLKNGKVSAMEKLALSLYILGNRESNSNATERFQRSGETVSRIFTDMLHIFARMGIDTIKPIEGQFEEVPNRIRHDTIYWSHFKDCIGAIDGTHIKACISPSSQYLISDGNVNQLKILWQLVTSTCALFLHFLVGKEQHIVRAHFARAHTSKPTQLD
ncbi:uncharacterized protein [Gossypium hirsutum]|uniref:DUF8040 domain-containing protein n=1 Tax=Gossypium hirsutum TaxID=3635 RepID=A0ABM2YJ63_GOSHI|nr:uncharacterized protein LOC121204578 [Gossypium hirsutum]